MKTQTHSKRNYLSIRYLVLCSLLLFCLHINAQNTEPNMCKMEEQMQKLYEADPYAKTEIKALRQSASRMKNSQNPKSYVIPVVFHVFGTEFNSGSTVTKAIIEDALQKTNEDFQGLNADYSTIDAPFDVIKQPLDVTFKLAQLDPNGNPTTGVIFYDKASGMGNYNSPVVAKVAWDNYKYCNIYITRDLYDDGDFYNSGVAWYPNTTMSAANIARVVYNGSYLGNNTNENFRSVLTHEFGHYFDLPHTFDKGVCNNDPNDGDGVADTPSHKKSSSRTKCNVLKNCLDQEINSENFMDYTDCYKMFTQGQVTRMVNALDNSSTRNTLWTNTNLTATGLASDLGARIATSGAIFEERYLNDGIVESTIDITCEDCTFTKNSGNMVLNTDYTVANLPAGLTPRIVVNSNTSATIHLDNTASNHNLANSVTNLSFTFLDPIVTGGVTQLYKKSLDNLKVNFNDVYTEYCNVNISYAVYTHITNVEFDGRTNPSGYDGISNYTKSLKYPAKQGKTYPLTITTNKGNGGAGDNLRIQGWFDWNNNFIYEDSELIISHAYANSSVDANGDYKYTTNITIPAGAVLGNTAFRILAHYAQNNDGDTACSRIDSGESEDYGLNIIDQNATFSMAFSGTPTAVNFSQGVAFSDLTITDNGDSITSWLWTFEGGQPATSTDKSPSNIIFPEGGTYDVSLKVTTANGINKTLTKTDYITSALNYCDSGPKFGGYFNVNHVTLSTLDHAPLKSRAGDYYDTVFTTLETGKTYPITIKTERGNGGTSDVNRVRVWADWNFDSVFSDNELVATQVVNHADYTNDEYSFTANITVPNNAAVGKKVGLRVIGHFVKGTEGDTACGSYDSGNTADYGITISGGTSTTCNDGIQNGDETGVDCGGSCSPCNTNDTYCAASNQDDRVHITRVAFGDIDNSSTHSPYSDYTNLSANFTVGDQLSLTINTVNEHWTYNALGAWVDWNNDKDFDDSGEEILHIYKAGPYSSTVTVPTSAITGTPLRMRVRMGYGSESKITPCGDDTYFGEVEDYTIVIKAVPTCTDGIQNGNETGVDCGGSCTPCTTNNGVVYVDVNDIIVSSSNTWNFFRIEVGDDNGYGAWFSSNSVRLVTYDKDVVCEGTSRNATMIGEGIQVGASSNFVAESHSYIVSSSSYTNWNGKSGYIGFTFKIGGNTHYGWFYATVANDGLSYTILDYAYNTNAGQGLLTKRPAAAGPEKAENLVKVYPNSFTETTNIDLTKLGKERFTMSVYDLLGRRIYHKNYDRNPGVLPFGETITEKGNYFVKITSKGTSEIHTIVKK